MYMKIISMMGFATLIATPAFSNGCESIIALSKVQSVTISDESTVDQHAANFCNEYSSGSRKTEGTSFGASYEFLSASFGQSGSSLEEVASKYCSASETGKASKDSYRQYVESISPNAYKSYEQCVKMSEQSIKYNIDEASILPEEFTLTVSFSAASTNDNTAELAVSSPRDVACSWGNNNEDNTVIRSGATEFLKCSRTDTQKKSYVTVISKSHASTPMSLSWPAYSPEGYPVDRLKEMHALLESLVDAGKANKSEITDLKRRLNDRINGIKLNITRGADLYDIGENGGERNCDGDGIAYGFKNSANHSLDMWRCASVGVTVPPEQ